MLFWPAVTSLGLLFFYDVFIVGQPSPAPEKAPVKTAAPLSDPFETAHGDL